MYPTEIIAKFLGIIFVVFAISLFMRPAQMKTALTDVITNPSHFLIASIINLMGGTLLVLFHTRFGGLGTLLVTLICWVLFVRSIGLMLMPEKIAGFATKVLENPQHFRMMAIVHAVLGVILLAIGFM